VLCCVVLPWFVLPRLIFAGLGCLVLAYFVSLVLNLSSPYIGLSFVSFKAAHISAKRVWMSFKAST
jgi:hypothetical protein